MPRSWQFFSASEVKNLDQRLVLKLDIARGILGSPIVITSGWRTPEQNKKAGGVKGSAHEKGLAVDIRAPSKEYRTRLVKALRDVGFTRIGIYDKHVHADIDDTKPQVVWAGGRSHA